MTVVSFIAEKTDLYTMTGVIRCWDMFVKPLRLATKYCNKPKAGLRLACAFTREGGGEGDQRIARVVDMIREGRSEMAKSPQ